MPALTDAPPYVYRCADRSLLLPLFRDRWVAPFARRLPERLPANVVTLAASAFMWAALALVAAAGALPPPALALAFVVLVQLYLLGDHADGMHAKRTGTSSALGEYLDHALDGYHGPIVVLAFFALVGFGNRALVMVMLWTLQVAFSATMVEERERGELHLGPVGSLEGMLLFSAFFLTWLVPPLQAAWLAPLPGGVPAYALAVAVGALGTGATVWGCVWRMGRLPAQLALFVAAGLALAVLLARGPLPLGAGVACLLLYGGDHAGRVIGSHLVRRPQPWPDPVAPAVAAFLVAAPAAPAWVGGALLAYLALRTAWGAAGVLRPLRSSWRWSNA
ncbi:MAG TPA: CDP-alcohol phosphatidyltransferase family protein [Candidatus Dormibacteraeota bacterium]|nr:CDP-alcohol phosphatidyltransferase family protein [Candidatus Dormibacteraeota bacterium]